MPGNFSLNQTGQQTLSVTTTAQSLTLPTTVNARPTHILIHNDSDQPLRWQANGTAPTSTAGMLLRPRSFIDFTDFDVDYYHWIINVQFIRDTLASANANLEIAYFA